MGRGAGLRVAQIIGAFVGVAVAHLMFEHPLFALSPHARAGAAQLLSEFVATFGLLAVIRGCGQRQATAVRGRRLYRRGLLVHGVHVVRQPGRHARAGRDRHVRRHPSGGRPGFIAAQLVGAVAATALFRWLVPSVPAALKVVGGSARASAKG